MTRHRVSVDTIETLALSKNGSTWRQYAERLGYEESYAATLNKAARGVPGAMTATAENILRVKLGLPPVYTISVPACPDCGSAHVGRCNGKAVVQVVVLGENERIIRKGPQRTRKRYHRPCMDDVEYAEYLAWKQGREA